jgi:hypothetical protein
LSVFGRPKSGQAGFGHTLYEIEGHNAKDIGNCLHEGVMPPGKFEVIAPPVRERGKARAPIDARTILETDQVRVRLRRIAR